MIISSIIQGLAVVFTVFAAATCSYYLLLAGVAWLKCYRPSRRAVTDVRDFAILIPAHNEAANIEAVLDSCAALDYPRANYQVIVIADNCTDATAAIARARGVTCLERHAEEHRGKGQALAWALERILPQQPDAVLILDADCRLDRHALATFNRYLASGHQVLQASYVAANPEDSIVSYVASVANGIENDLFYRPKSQLGWAVLLRGTGMVFRREVLERCPWNARSIVEDAEYTARLYQAGIPVRLVPEVCVHSAFPAEKRQMLVQRRRWVGGNFRLACAQFFPLLWHGVCERRWIFVDLAWTLLAASRTLVVVQLLLTLLLAVLADWLTPGPLSRSLLITACGLVGCQVLYFALGVIQLGLNVRRLQLLAQTPATVLRLLFIASLSILPGRIRSWERTPR
jgi:cellulose synthase/poly-beta-1,6-N-acetylglucosamine synthase-like glycosyltransferase